MTAEQERYFKSFLDHMFDHIMDLEERALHHVGADDLSVRELHVLDAVGERMADGRNTMTGIADGLSIQVSSLTVAVNTLVRKGYLVRERENRDRRVIRVLLTEKGAEASRVHTQFYGRVMCQSTEHDVRHFFRLLPESLIQYWVIVSVYHAPPGRHAFYEHLSVFQCNGCPVSTSHFIYRKWVGGRCIRMP